MSNFEIGITFIALFFICWGIFAIFCVVFPKASDFFFEEDN